MNPQTELSELVALTKLYLLQQAPVILPAHSAPQETPRPSTKESSPPQKPVAPAPTPTAIKPADPVIEEPRKVAPPTEETVKAKEDLPLSPKKLTLTPKEKKETPPPITETLALLKKQFPDTAFKDTPLELPAQQGIVFYVHDIEYQSFKELIDKMVAAISQQLTTCSLSVFDEKAPPLSPTHAQLVMATKTTLKSYPAIRQHYAKSDKQTGHCLQQVPLLFVEDFVNLSQNQASKVAFWNQLKTTLTTCTPS